MQKVDVKEASKKLFKDKPIIWIDCEMTGLDLENDRLIEMAVVITDKNLEQYIEGPNLIIKQSDELLETMDEWCRTTHGESGLTEKVRNSNLTEMDAQQQIIKFIKPFVHKGRAMMAGNSIHCDRRFIDKYMPKLASYFSYRLIDVSSIKELGHRWYSSKQFKTPKKKLAHRALDDIYESIRELKYYKDAIFEIESPRIVDRNNTNTNTELKDIAKEEETAEDFVSEDLSSLALAHESTAED